MNRKSILFQLFWALFILIFCSASHAQISFSNQIAIIQTEKTGARSFYAANLDSIVEQTWSSESRDGDLEWYNGPMPIRFPFVRQSNITMTPINDDDSITTIYVDPSRTYQIFEGFGESFEGSTVYNLSRMSCEKRTEVLKLLIDPDIGAGFNLFRICIGTSDFTPTKWDWYSLDDPPNGEPDPNLEHFSIQKDSVIISVLKEALHIAKSKNVNLRFIASPWSPPAWMKTTGSMCGDALKEEYNCVYAHYLFRFLEEYKKQGIPIYAITVQNEPGWVTSTPSTCMLPDQQASIIKELKKLIDNNPEIDTKILAHDWNFDDTHCHIERAKAVLKEVNNEVYGVAFHSYDWEPNDEDHIVELHQLYPNLKMYHTEGGMWRTEGMDRIVKMFRHWISTYVGWVTMLDNDNIDDGDEDEQYSHYSKKTPTPPPFILDASNPDNYWITPTYYLKQQFSKFIQLGAVRIYSNVGAFQLSNVAFLNPDNTIVLIVVNQDPSQAKTFRVVICGTEQFIAAIPETTVATYKWKSQMICLPKENLAKGKDVKVSSVEFNNFRERDGRFAVDGDPDTRWASDWSDSQWIYVDLGSIKNISQVILDWEDAFGKEYEIQITSEKPEDESIWTTICHEKKGYIGVNIHNVSGKGRYVKMKGIKRGTNYGYSLYEFEVYGVTDSTHVEQRTQTIPGQYFLSQNYPNPFNSSTKITFELPKTSEVELVVFDVLGRRVRTLEHKTHPAGIHSIVWGGDDNVGNPVPSGIYFLQMQVDQLVFTCKAILLK